MPKTMNAAAELEKFYSRCLLCTCTPDITPHLNIFSEAGSQLLLAEKINKYLDIQIVSELPKNVCNSCMEKLEVTHELATSSQQARVTLLQIKQQIENFGQEPNNFQGELTFHDKERDGDLTPEEENEIATEESNENIEQSIGETLISEIDIEEHEIKLEQEENQSYVLLVCKEKPGVDSQISSKLLQSYGHENEKEWDGGDVTKSQAYSSERRMGFL
ncbi:hypothetical protein B566_EDAN016016 [Ephemera danica]|nr:hypothetical protein B566_EDAN016016 [Ephemera danica]